MFGRKYCKVLVTGISLVSCKSGLPDPRSTGNSGKTTEQARPDDVGNEPDWFKLPDIKDPEWFQPGSVFSEVNLQRQAGMERLNAEDLKIQSCALVDRAGGFPVGLAPSQEEAAKLKGKFLYFSFDSKKPRDAGTSTLEILIPDEMPPKEGANIVINDRSIESGMNQWVSYSTAVSGQQHQFLTNVSSSSCTLQITKSEAIDTGLSANDADAKGILRLYKFFLAGALNCNLAWVRDGDAVVETLGLKAGLGCSGFYLRAP